MFLFVSKQGPVTNRGTYRIRWGPCALIQPGMASTSHILVVEDDRETRDLIARYLEGRGFRVATARNGAEMLERLDNGNFSLLLP